MTVEKQLLQAARRGELETAKRIFNDSGCRALHIAIEAGNTEFLRWLVDKMNDNQLTYKDKYGNTAFCLAAEKGEKELALIMVEKNPGLAAIRGRERLFPIHMAAFQGHREMVKLLYKKTDFDQLDQDDRINLLVCSIEFDMFDIALDIIDVDGGEDLLILKDRRGETVLAALARKPQMLSSSRFSIFSCSKDVQKKALELLDRICDKLATMNESEITALVGGGYMFSAVENGNVEFLRALIHRCPDLAIRTNNDGHTIFHAAVLHRQKEIFELIHTTGSLKKEIARIIDKKGNHILHLAAGLAPAHRLASIPGEALQYQHELLWFQEVKRLVGPLLAEERNLEDDPQTPSEIFIQNHQELLENAKQWLKDIVSPYIAIIVLFAGLVWKIGAEPGGTNQNTGDSMFPVGIARSIVIISAVTLFSFHMSAYSPEKFVREIPIKLLIGLGTLFASMAFPMLASFGYTVPMIVFVFLLLLVSFWLLKGILSTIIKSTPLDLNYKHLTLNHSISTPGGNSPQCHTCINHCIESGCSPRDYVTVSRGGHIPKLHQEGIEAK